LTDQTDRMQAAVAGIIRALKVAEGAVMRTKGALRLAPPDAQALQVIAGRDGIIAGGLAQALGVAPTTATSIVDRLARRGFVRRDRAAADRRVVTLTLTDDGHAAVARLIADERTAAAMMLAALGENEREAVVDAVTRIAAHMEAEVRKLPGG
jgi:DNA-binding MarR family transcriptional regulator